MLCTIGKLSLKVYQHPRVGVLSTGNELVSPDAKEVPLGKIRDSNKAMLMMMLAQLPCTVTDLGSVQDSTEELQSKFSSNCDLIVTTGGVSMGELDLIKPFLQ